MMLSCLGFVARIKWQLAGFQVTVCPTAKPGNSGSCVLNNFSKIGKKKMWWETGRNGKRGRRKYALNDLLKLLPSHFPLLF